MRYSRYVVSAFFAVTAAALGWFGADALARQYPDLLFPLLAAWLLFVAAVWFACVRAVWKD